MLFHKRTEATFTKYNTQQALIPRSLAVLAIAVTTYAYDRSTSICDLAYNWRIYQGEKTQRIREYRDHATPSLDEFVNGDLTFLGLPLPQESACTWQSGIIKCSWTLDEGSYLQKYLSAAFGAIDRQGLLARSISMVGLSMDGNTSTASWVTAPGVKHPTGYIPRPGPSRSHSTHLYAFGKVPSAPKSITLARMGASPMARPCGAISSRSEYPKVERPLLRKPRDPEANPEKAFSSPNTISDGTRSMKQEERQPTATSDASKASVAQPHRHTPPCNTGTPQSHSGSAYSHAAPDVRVKVEETNISLGQPHSPLTKSIARETGASTSVPSSLTTPSATTSAPPTKSDGSVSSLTREVWDVRREIAALSAREIALQTQLKRLGARPAPEPPVPPFVEDEITKLRAQLRSEYAARKTAESSLREEQRRRELAEAVVADVRRDCKTPFVVPALVDAFLQMSRITEEVIGVGSRRNTQCSGV
ncbi:uncharacterized protein B0H18DRAFT_1198522 [Fomitopsis serialis]|uniref:uncharacterized protein n=1 Tax=Fomitopsis serialis TaxID=139415 RepID=UPI0020073B9A|nr:uncharacterized protein B0H18DRAFT_1198522 [Neoantrodia serialis]KAH9918605.1 hypothetical protein B0H18DRAFT_1198522 [Neoantrodia serialis]